MMYNLRGARKNQKYVLEQHRDRRRQKASKKLWYRKLISSAIMFSTPAKTGITASKRKCE